jgi:hypothetical protein
MQTMANRKRGSSLAALLDDFLGALTVQVSAGAARGAAGRPKGVRRRKLDMRCRVAGCKNLSRGPRFGFICDIHRKQLSKKEQAAARDAWNAKHKA